MKQIKKSLLILTCIFGVSALSGQTAEITLKVGDPAPPLKSVTWLKNGPAAEFGDGKIHVVEFWATWCGPCRQNMPHLTNLARKYCNKIHVTSISIWEAHGDEKMKSLDLTSKAKSFVDGANEMMSYTVGTDMNDVTAKTWMSASGQNGIPCSFVVDGSGKIAWIGIPFTGLDEVVRLLSEGKFDPTVDKAKIAENYKRDFSRWKELQTQANTAIKNSEFEKAITLADEAIRIMPVFDEGVIAIKYRALDQIDRERSRAYAKELMKTHAHVPILMLDLVSSILSDPDGDYDTALQLAIVGERCAPNVDGRSRQTIAQAYAKVGEYAKAAEVQEQVVKAMEDPRALGVSADRIEEAKAALKEYVEAAKSKN